MIKLEKLKKNNWKNKKKSIKILKKPTGSVLQVWNRKNWTEPKQKKIRKKPSQTSLNRFLF